MSWRKKNRKSEKECQSSTSVTAERGKIPDAPTPDEESKDLSFYGQSVYVRLRGLNPLQRVKDFLQDAYGY